MSPQTPRESFIGAPAGEEGVSQALLMSMFRELYEDEDGAGEG
jgi:hypothetical protein